MHHGNVTGSDGMALAGDIPWSPTAVAGSARMAAVRAQRTHPVVLWFGPTYGVMERTGAGWMMSCMRDATPQMARDGLGWWFRIMALRRSTDEALRESYWAGSELLERERLNDLVVAGRRFRIVRADQFARYGQAGPEPPRPTDLDTRPEREYSMFDMFTGGVLGPAQEPGGPELLGELWTAVPEDPKVPPEVTRDARAALTSHPKIVMLPTRFAVTREDDGNWTPHSGAVASPHDARRVLATYFEHIAPALLEPSADELAAYETAARLLRCEPLNEITAAGRRFRVTRVETVVRVGPDGPEPSRPSDYDPDPPLTGETAALRTRDLIDDD